MISFLYFSFFFFNLFLGFGVLGIRDIITVMELFNMIFYVTCRFYFN